jgi:hypothetical protein
VEICGEQFVDGRVARLLEIETHALLAVNELDGALKIPPILRWPSAGLKRFRVARR